MNQLAQEKSPYLLQHASNPVDWYAWSPEAFEKAKKENKPIFLSIGYSTCHWCHVMAHESFENEEIARLLNQDFISIKVDREERPDVDQLYMSAVQALTGSGGWPLSVFLTPEGKPFAGGTYFPPEDRWGRSGMKTLLPQMAKVWKQNRPEAERAGDELTRLLAPRSGADKDSASVLKEDLLHQAYGQFDSRFDAREGGFGGAPKFPRSHDLSFLLRYHDRTKEKHALDMVHLTLVHMARGGMYDQLGGGFHRYSTDEHWLVPHFEKMLYDQAILAKTYLESYQATQEKFYADVARDIFRYVLRDMTDAQGGFYSAEDADSEGEEGKFYVWRPEEIIRILGQETGRLFNEYYGVTDEGNFEHTTSILHVSPDSKLFPGLEEARRKLFEVRKKRIHPHKDDKILTAWNGMMISALALGSQILGDKHYAGAAEKAARFVLGKMQSKGRLLRRYRAGEAALLAYQEDYAFFGVALLDLYETTFDPFWLSEARRVNEEMIRLFWDEEAGGFFYTARDAEVLLARSKEYYDGAVPSGNSMAALLMLRLGRMLADSSLEEKVEVLLKSNAAPLTQYPMAFPQLLTALDFALGPAAEIMIAGRRQDPGFDEALKLIRRHFLPRHVVLHDLDKPVVEGKITVYLCENRTCQSPTTDLQELERRLKP